MEAFLTTVVNLWRQIIVNICNIVKVQSEKN